MDSSRYKCTQYLATQLLITNISSRDEKDLNRIRHYIINNPARWADDKYYKNGGDNS
ncbi:MAG: hypothetical protein MRJ65_13395 [Candidatus Brocadiaceae bacterium]|nr:hypothetical protein [Candidatus Brocadiaceae bacterium]